MFNKLTWFLAYKYFSSRHENGIISFISVISVIGVALGTAVLIIVLSVLNGFKEHIEHRLLQNQPHVIINSNNIEDFSSINKQIKNIKSSGINNIDIYPLIQEQGLLKLANDVLPVNIVSDYAHNLDPSASLPKNSNIHISELLAQRLDIKINNTIILAAPILKDSVVGPQPRFKRFTVTGFISKINKSYLNNADILMPYDTALKFFDFDNNFVTSLYVYLDKPLASQDFKAALKHSGIFKENIVITTWQQNNQSLFQAIKLERASITILLLIIITVACFNILSGLFIQVSEKQKDVAILKTLGLTGYMVTSIFVLQGMIIALIGGCSGVLFGVLISSFLDSIFFCLQHYDLLNTSNVFFNAIVNHTIEINVNYHDVAIIFILSFVLCTLATIIPALRASKILPIEALRNE